MQRAFPTHRMDGQQWQQDQNSIETDEECARSTETRESKTLTSEGRDDTQEESGSDWLS